MRHTGFETRKQELATLLSSAYAGQRALMWTGLIGVVLGTLVLGWMAVRGRYVPPEGDLYKAGTFDVAIGLYALTVALFAPYAGFTERGRRVWDWTLAGVLLYSLGAETTQMLRGIDPRFTRVGSNVDQIFGNVLALAAVCIVASFVVLAWRFFARRSTVRDALVLTGLRYGCAAAVLGFATGFWLGLNEGARVGATGNLLPLHAAGFHGLQAVPLVALLLAWSRFPRGAARLWVHAAGLAWCGACLALAWQTADGRGVLEPSAASLLALALFAAWAVCAARAALAWARSRPDKLSGRVNVSAAA